MKTLDVYRLSISWARLFPTGFEDQPNPEGVMYYDRIIRTLAHAGIKVFITINHYAMPIAIVGKYNPVIVHHAFRIGLVLETSGK
jgi:6-phospho-beta-glucosidase